MSYSKEFDTPEIQRKREQIRTEINRNCINTKEQSAEKYKKTPEERLQLANLKLKCFTDIRKAGFDPKKRMNVAEPTTGKVW